MHAGKDVPLTIKTAHLDTQNMRKVVINAFPLQVCARLLSTDLFCTNELQMNLAYCMWVR